MRKRQEVTLTIQETLRLDLIEAVIAKKTSIAEAAQSMEVTPRHCRRLLNRYNQLGPDGLISLRRGKPSNNRLDDELKTRTINVLSSECHALGPTKASVHLATHHSINLSARTIRRLMTELSLWVPRKNKS